MDYKERGGEWERMEDEINEQVENRGRRPGKVAGSFPAHLAKQLSPVMIALLAMLLLAGSTLTILVLQSTRSRRQEALQQEKDARMQEQLEEIQLYLSSVDESLATGQVTDSESYDKLSREVTAMQQNLTEYRDNNEIGDDSIGENLDDVIAQLSSIQDNLEEEKAVSQKLQDKTAASAAAAGEVKEENRKTAENLQNTVNTQLANVREDIRSLMKEASGENKAEYQELLSVLSGTDADLNALEKNVAAGHEKLQSALNSGLGTINGSVSGLKGTLTSVQETMVGVKDLQSQAGIQQSKVLEQQSTVLEKQAAFAAQQSEVLEQQKAIADQLSSLQNAMVAERRNIQSVLEAQNLDQKSQVGNLEVMLEEMWEEQQEFFRGMAELQEEIRTTQSDMDAYLHNESCGLMGIRDSFDQQEKFFAQHQEKLEGIQALLDKMQEQLDRLENKQNGKTDETAAGSGQAGAETEDGSDSAGTGETRTEEA